MSTEIVSFVPKVEVSKTEISPINSVAIRESSFGSYLESINTGGTWFQSVQESLGFNPSTISALDATYMATGALGLAMLVPLAVGTGPVSLLALAGGSSLMAFSAIGLSEEDRRTKIATGMAAGATVLTNPSAVALVAKEAYSATKETVKQTAQLANSSIGLVTAGLGLGTTLVAVNVYQKNKKRKTF